MDDDEANRDVGVVTETRTNARGSHSDPEVAWRIPRDAVSSSQNPAPVQQDSSTEVLVLQTNRDLKQGSMCQCERSAKQGNRRGGQEVR